MGKTKRLAEELTEKERPEKPLEVEPTGPRVIKMRGLTGEVLDKLVEYLDTKPHGEVKGILAMLGQSPILDVTVTDAK